MKLDFNDMLFAFSHGLDCVEHEIVGVSSHHSKRVAYMVSKMAKSMKMEREQRRDLTACALLHDNALSEYLWEEQQKETGAVYVRHCVLGEENRKLLPFKTDVKGFILYHHENADGTGTFHKKAQETPMGAQLIHLGDILDATFHLDVLSDEKFQQIKDYLLQQKDREFSKECVDLFLQEFTREQMEDMTKEHLEECLQKEFFHEEREYTKEEIYGFCRMFAKIIDYKSSFTTTHSMGVAQKAEKLARYYQYGEEMITKIYLAGALHDIGKLAVNNDVLEKAGRLTSEEFLYVQNHAMGTYQILSQIKGMEDVVNWASLHHEKLNGQGYPFGKSAKELGFIERMMGCIDIYQALTEVRPYKAGMEHEEALSIMKTMVKEGYIDGSIVADINEVFSVKAE